MDQFLAAADGAWRVLLTCLLLGVGLPALYTIGLRNLAFADGAMNDQVSGGRRGLHRAIAYALFAIVVLAILLGLSYIIAHGFGWSIGFNGIVPTFTKK